MKRIEIEKPGGLDNLKFVDAEQGKAEKIDELAKVLSNPFVDLGKSMDKYCQPAPKEQQNQQLSCSS